jgi:mannose/cellobiose epimerase-like protein (N-acyl-D-glucosamine 2-epimerase family)
MTRPAPQDPVEPPDAGWLAGERHRLWDFAREARHPRGGFAWLDDRGRPDLDRPTELWITCRMTHVAALELLLGNADASDHLEHGVRALETTLRDPEHGGWYASVGDDGPVVTDKRCYEHVFVLLAASSAAAAGHPRGRALLADAVGVFDAHFWSDAEGMCVDVWDRGWHDLEPYRGANANMHAVEAFLAVHDVTGDPTWRDRALRVVERLVHDVARSHDWRLPEHFTPDWEPVPDYNRDDPAHPFRPYGVTIGHLLEWSRLALHLRATLGAAAPDWLLADARALFDTAVRDGWAVDGADGFVYTTDFSGAPVVRSRLHWVVAEAIGAASTLSTATGDAAYAHWYATWWDHARTYFVDEDHGSWRHELDELNRPASTVWLGKPDIYHAYQAALLPTLGEISSFSGALVGGAAS